MRAKKCDRSQSRKNENLKLAGLVCLLINAHVTMVLVRNRSLRQHNAVKTSVTHSAIASCATFLFLPHFDVICDLLLNRSAAKWNVFVKCSKASFP